MQLNDVVKETNLFLPCVGNYTFKILSVLTRYG